MRQKPHSLLLLLFAVAFLTAAACNNQQSTTKYKVIVEANLSAEELNEIVIVVEDNRFGAYDIELEPGFYNYIAGFGKCSIEGSFKVFGDTLLQLHFPTKASLLLGVGHQPHVSPDMNNIAYNSGDSIKVYNLDTKETQVIGVSLASFNIVGWLNQDSLIIDSIIEQGTWLIPTGQTAAQPDRIFNGQSIWSPNRRIAGIGTPNVDSFEYSIDRIDEFKIVKYHDGYNLVAISNSDYVAFLNQEAGQSFLRVYSCNKDKELLILESDEIVADLVNFSGCKHYLTYYTAGKDGTQRLVIYDVPSEKPIMEIDNPGLWIDWDSDDNRLLLTRDNQILIYDFLSKEESLIYQADLDSRATKVAFLNHSKIAFIEEGQLYIYNIDLGSKELVDDQVYYFVPLRSLERLLYISDYNFILLTSY